MNLTYLMWVYIWLNAVSQVTAKKILFKYKIEHNATSGTRTMRLCQTPYAALLCFSLKKCSTENGQIASFPKRLLLKPRLKQSTDASAHHEIVSNRWDNVLQVDFLRGKSGDSDKQMVYTSEYWKKKN